MQNPGIYASQGIANGGFSDYNSLQLELRRQFRNGFFGQMNYTFAKTNTDSAGTAQNRFEAFMDNTRPELNTGRSIFQYTHVINANAIVELPFGQGKKWLNSSGVLDAIVGGWQLAAIVAWSSGSPISITSQRGTFNRAGRSNCTDPIGCNTAFSTMSAKRSRACSASTSRRTAESTGSIRRSWTRHGRAVGADNSATRRASRPGVLQPGSPGEVGNLPILAFDGPSQFRIDLALSKRIRFTDEHRFEVKGEAFNLTNTPSFFTRRHGHQQHDVRPATGRSTSRSRVVQLSVRFEF